MIDLGIYFGLFGDYKYETNY